MRAGDRSLMRIGGVVCVSAADEYDALLESMFAMAVMFDGRDNGGSSL